MVLEEASVTDLEETLETTLEEDLETTLEEILETNIEKVSDTYPEDDNVPPDYDVILQVKPEKISQIKSQIIDGQKCIVIPINDDEQTTVNGIDHLI